MLTFSCYSFTWLDEGEGKDLSLSVCSREKLENERIMSVLSEVTRLMV